MNECMDKMVCELQAAKRRVDWSIYAVLAIHFFLVGGVWVGFCMLSGQSFPLVHHRKAQLVLKVLAASHGVHQQLAPHQLTHTHRLVSQAGRNTSWRLRCNAGSVEEGPGARAEVRGVVSRPDAVQASKKLLELPQALFASVPP